MLAAASDADRPALERVVDRALELVPGLTEGTSYAMPALLHRGWPLLSVMPCKNFLSLYPFSAEVVGTVASDLPGFERTKGSIHFSTAQPIPDPVLDQIIALCAERTASKKPR
jgi:uncharacterized protein YdhG (YjbR/CyaY superfamily)